MAKKIKKETKEKSEGKLEQCESTFNIEPTNVQFWKSIAKTMLPDENDEMKLGEFGLSLQLTAGLLQRNWEAVDGYASRHDKVKIGSSLTISRKATPSSVKVSLKGAVEGVDDSAESDVPDVNQTELPGMEKNPIEPEESETPDLSEFGPRK